MTENNGVRLKWATFVSIVSGILIMALYISGAMGASKNIANEANMRSKSVEQRLERIEHIQLRQETKLDQILLRLPEAPK